MNNTLSSSPSIATFSSSHQRHRHRQFHSRMMLTNSSQFYIHNHAPPSTSHVASLDPYDRVRSHFPYFRVQEKQQQGLDLPVFMENAGGSQCPAVVIDAIAQYMRCSYVQPGAGYPLSELAQDIVKSAHDFVKVFMNVSDGGDVVFGASSSHLLAMLALCYGRVLQQGDEVIVHEANHEANAGPWVRMAQQLGLSLKFWRVDYESFESSLDELAQLLSPRTRILAVAHVSNLLGGIMDLQQVVRFVKERVGCSKVRVVADGVAYAPHRSIDVKKWGVDWYVFSTYKVYGPHMAVLFGTAEAFGDVIGVAPNHYFIGSDELGKKFELGGVCHESCAGILSLAVYLQILAASERNGEASEDGMLKAETRGGRENDFQQHLSGSDILQSVLKVSSQLERIVIEDAFAYMTQLEQPLQEMLLSYLRSRDDLVIVGSEDTDSRTRVPTISFIHKRKTSSEICQKIQEAGYAIRNGHMYAYRLVFGMFERQKLMCNTVDDGVVRISMLHYNTPAEVSQLIARLDTILQCFDCIPTQA